MIIVTVKNSSNLTVVYNFVSILNPFHEFLLHCRHFYYRTDTALKSAKAEFKLGQTFEETTIDGRKMQTTFRVILIQHSSGTEFYALAQYQEDANGNLIKILRFIRNDNLQVIMQVEATTAFAVFEAVK